MVDTTMRVCSGPTVPASTAARNSGSTSANLDTTPALTVVTDVYPTTGHGAGRVLRVNYNFTNASNPWLRLTTGGAYGASPCVA